MAAEKMREIRISIPEELFSFIIPSRTNEHLLRAKKEILLALRSLIDARIESLEKRAEPKPETKRKIKVE
jgi:hypothetical protein